MTLAEFQAWIAFDKHFPIDDRARIYKPAAVIASSWSGMTEERMRMLMSILAPDPRDKTAELRPATIVKSKG